MPSFSATDRAPPAGIRPVATSASHPSAAAASVSNRAATNSAASRNASSADGGLVPATTERTVGPSGTSGTPTRGQQLRELLVRRRAHPHLRAEFPQPHRESRQRFDIPARSLRRQQHTHFATPHFRRFWPRPAILRHDRGLAASPPVRYKLRVARSGYLLAFRLFVVRCGRTASSRSRGPPRAAVRRAGGSPLGRPVL